MIDGQTLAQTALDQIGLMANDMFDAHEELRERVEGAGWPVARPGSVIRRTLWGVPALIYRFKDGSALSLAEHTDYYGNIHLVGGFMANSLNWPPSEEKAPLSAGTMVFWAGQPIPWWVVEWQPENGEGAYWLVDANGAWGSAAPDELHTKPRHTRLDG